MSYADKVYHDLLVDISENGHRKGDRTGTGTVSVYGRQIRFDMSKGFPLLTTKKLHMKSIIHELIWFLNGDTNIKYLNDNGVTIWDEWADENGELGPVYGKQWVNWASGHKIKHEDSDDVLVLTYTNQIQNAIDTLKKNPDSRRNMVNAWNPGEIDEMALPPCHYGFQLWTREMSYKERAEYWCKVHGKSYPWFTDGLDDSGLDNLGCPRRKISLMWNQRSVDTFLGLPFNIASYALLLHMFAQQVNMVPEELIANLGDTHVYMNHFEYVKKQLDRDVNKYSAPELRLHKADDIFSYKFEDFELVKYGSYSNWKNVPIAI